MLNANRQRRLLNTSVTNELIMTVKMLSKNSAGVQLKIYYSIFDCAKIEL